MTVVTQGITPARSYSPFEGMSENMRLHNGVPRGLVRFTSAEALDAKPVNDQINVTWTCSLPDNFAYVLAAVTMEIAVDTATDWNATARFRIFNGLPNGVIGNNQVGMFDMADVASTSSADPQRVLTYRSGTPREMFPLPVTKTPGAVGHSFILQYSNVAAAVQAAGTQSFQLSAYQYDLTQAVRYPLNAPIPTTLR